jgi:hypothetical protein
LQSTYFGLLFQVAPADGIFLGDRGADFLGDNCPFFGDMGCMLGV